MSKKALQLTAAVAAVFAAQSASALAPGAIDPQNPTSNDVVIHYGGATAQLETATSLADNFCVASTLDTYFSATGNSTTNGLPNSTHRVITCELQGAGSDVPASIQGKNLYFSYHQDGGSIYGVTPVIDQIALPNMRVFGGTCAVSGVQQYTCQNGNDGTLSPSSDQYSAAPVAGGSDVEPALFKGTNILGLDFGAPVGSDYVAAQAYNVIFGIPVSCNLLDHTVYTSCTSATSGPITSLSKASVQAIFAGNKSVWETVPEYGLVENNFAGTANDTEAFLFGLTAGTEIHVCRRAPGSGTQASAQAYWLNEECDSPQRSFVSTAATGSRVDEFSSSSGILHTCMDLNDNSIGISSLEKGPGAQYGTNWAYVALDGVFPTAENAAFGNYDYMFENSMQYNSAVITSDQLDYINAMFTSAQDPSVLAGEVGVLAIPVGANLPLDFGDADGDGVLAEWNPDNPVASVIRDGNACRPHTSAY